MTVITLRLTALALYRKPSRSTNFNAPPPIAITHDVLIPAWL